MKTPLHHISSSTLKWLMLLLLATSCGVQKPLPGLANSPVVIYKTKQDYRKLVSVQLAEDGRSVSAAIFFSFSLSISARISFKMSTR